MGTHVSVPGYERAVVFIGVGSAIATAVQLAIGIVSARALAPEGRGTLAILLAWAQMAAHIGVFGSDIVIARAAGGKKIVPARLVGAAIFHALLVGIGVGFPACFVMFAVMKTVEQNLLAIAGFYLFVTTSAGSVLFQAILLARGQFATFAALRILLSVLVLVFYSVLWTLDITRAELFFVSYAACNLAFTIVAVAVVDRPSMVLFSVNETLKTWCNLGHVRREAMEAGTGSLLRIAETTLPMIILGLLADNRAVGLFVVATVVTSVQGLLGDAYARVAFGNGAAGSASDGGLAPGRLFAVQVSVAAAVIPIGWWLLPVVYGAAFSEARVLLPFISLAAILASVALVMAEWLRGAGRAKVVVGPRLVAVIALLTLPFLSRSVTEPAIAVILAQALGSMVQAWVFTRAFSAARKQLVPGAGATGARPS